jgi:hypothetical protein
MPSFTIFAKLGPEIEKKEKSGRRKGKASTDVQSLCLSGPYLGENIVQRGVKLGSTQLQLVEKGWKGDPGFVQTPDMG